MARGKKQEILTLEERLQAALVPESEQPYKVPKNWCWARLGTSVDLYNGDRGTNYPSKKDYQSNGIPFINAGAIVDGKLNESGFNYISEEKYDALRAGKIQQGDILYCLRGSLGKTAMVHQNFKGAISSSLCILRTNNSLMKEYLYYLLCSNVIGCQQILAENGSAQPNLSAASVMDYMIPLSPLAEQQRIVDRIESLFAKLDEAKQKAQDALDSFEIRKAAILHKAFTGKLTAQWRKEHGVRMEGWRTVTFKDACLKITDGTHHSPVNTPTGEYMYVTAKNIKETGIDLTNITFVSKDVHDEIYSRCDVQYGDVLYIKDGATTGIATVNTIEEPFSLLSSVAVLRPDKKQVMAEYMAYNLNSSKTKTMMINNMSGNAITRLTLSKIKTAPITICSLDEQTEIVRILDNLLAKEQQAKNAAEGVLEQIDLIKKSILARAFRGELGTNNPNEESSISLLKEIIFSAQPKKVTSRSDKPVEVEIPIVIQKQLSTAVQEKVYRYVLENPLCTVEQVAAIEKNVLETVQALRELEEKSLILRNAKDDTLTVVI